MSRIFMFALVASGAFALIAIGLGRAHTSRVSACTGGLYGFEDAARQVDFIFIGDAIEVGDGINRAPTLTPVAAATAAPRSTPASPPNARPTLDLQVDLTGIGERFRVVKSIVGPAGDRLEVDQDTRRAVERAIRLWNGTGEISDCAVDRGAFRYALGARYLVFAATDTENGIITAQRYRIDGDQVRLDEQNAAFVPFLLPRDLYERFFRGVAGHPYGDGSVIEITADRVPLVSVLRAVAAIRGDPSIAPPDTGSAGLASGRR